jgi:hypothetical protein
MVSALRREYAVTLTDSPDPVTRNEGGSWTEPALSRNSRIEWSDFGKIEVPKDRAEA